ncbi:hypothetical protein EYF80_055415 [Liparis tanakae]|uniref:Uncharacterized protein n=1 Tax=Liparis tanakae TaxID=230148 RepID=A0A4Z2EZY0_9TELE|nr:hypothetical protein EYF80_055415 [Liparis tanakae]
MELLHWSPTWGPDRGDTGGTETACSSRPSKPDGAAKPRSMTRRSCRPPSPRTRRSCRTKVQDPSELTTAEPQDSSALPTPEPHTCSSVFTGEETLGHRSRRSHDRKPRLFM